MNFLRHRFAQWIGAILTVFLSLACFDIYRLTHFVWVPMFVVLPLAGFIYFMLHVWHEAETGAKSPEIKLVQGKEVLTIATTVDISEEEMGELIHWVATMPPSVRRKMRDVHSFEELIKR